MDIYVLLQWLVNMFQIELFPVNKLASTSNCLVAGN